MDNNNEIDQEVDAVMEIATEGQVDNRSSKRKCLIFLLIVALIDGFLVGILPEDSGYLTILEFVATFLFVFAVLVWCLLDAEECKFTISRKFSFCLVLFLAIAFPYYIFMSRKGMASLKAIGLAGLFLVLLVVAYMIGYLPGCLIFEVMNAR